MSQTMMNEVERILRENRELKKELSAWKDFVHTNCSESYYYSNGEILFSSSIRGNYK